MTSAEPHPAAPPPSRRPFQFSLRSLLLLFVVAASSLGVLGAWGLLVFALSVGLATYIYTVKPLWPLAVLALCSLCLWPALNVPLTAGGRALCGNNLRYIALALQNYHADHGCFPPAYVADKDGKPKHSWRVLILPYLECDYLYKAYNFAEPWDGPNNKKLLASRPSFYACPRNANASTPGAAHTNYVAVVGPNAAWAGDKSRKLGDFGKDAANTIMLIEVSDSDIAWTEPRDFSAETLSIAGGDSPAFTRPSHCLHDFDFFSTRDYRFGPSAAMVDGSESRKLPSNAVSAADLPKILKVGACTPKAIESYEEISEQSYQTNWPNIAALAVWLVSVGTLLTAAVRGRKANFAPVRPLADSTDGLPC